MDLEERVVAPAVLTIAGLDPTGGAGLLVDIKTFLAFGCAPKAAIASLTFQNARDVSGASHQSVETVREQLAAILAESPVAALKTGMLPTREIVSVVATFVREEKLPEPIVDPVLRSTSGYALMEADGVATLLAELMPLARLMTPNIPEAEVLSGIQINNEDDMRAVASRLREMGARAVLIKGGHLKHEPGARGQESGKKAVDVLDDYGSITVFRSDWIDAPNLRGTGCMLSAAIAACLAKGLQLTEAVDTARQFVAISIKQNSEHQTSN